MGEDGSNMIKRLLLYFIVTAMIFNMVGIVFVYHAAQLEIRKSIKTAIKRGVPPDELHHFYFTPTAFGELQWIKDLKEFRLKNQLFDIVTIEIRDGAVHLKCVNDIQEAQLFASLDDYVKHAFQEETKHPKSTKTKVFSLFKMQHVSEFIVTRIQRYPASVKELSFAYFESKGCEEYEVASPPPDFSC